MEFPGHFQALFQNLNQQRLQSDPLCDCRVQVAGCSFRAHSSVLAACSSHFRSLLHSTEPGGHAGGHPGGVNLTLDCEVVTPEAFSTLLEMVYTSRLLLRTSNVMDVLLAASHLHLNAVVRACKLYLSTRSFPTAPPRGWRSSGAAEQQQQSGPFLQRKLVVQHVDLSVDEELHQPDGLEMEVSQSGGGGVSRVQGEGPRSRKRRCRDDGSPTVSASRRGGEEEEELQLPLLEEEEEEEKYELPSQSHHSSSSLQDEEGVVKVKVGEEGEEEGGAVEVKEEELGCSSPLGGDRERPDVSDGQDLATATAGDDLQGDLQDDLQDDLQHDLQDDLQACAGEARTAGGADESLDDGEALDSLSELAFSCFLNPPTGSCDLGVMESLEAEQSLARLTAAAVSAAAESLARFTANANDALAHLNANANEGFAHIDANANQGLARLNASDGLAQVDANANECLALLDASEGLAQVNANASEGLAHLDANEGLSALTGCTANANDGLAYLNTATSTATATAVESASEQTLTPEATLSAEAATSNSFNSSSGDSPSSSSAVFPAVASLPFRRILSSRGGGGGRGFGDTLILRPAPLGEGGFLVPPPPAAGASGSSRGATAFRRIAPKATPPLGPEDPDASPSCWDGARPVPLTRASDDVLSKCKKAATEDNVLLVEGERKYACGLCCKTFTNLTDCKKHIRVHTGEKPYPCTLCGKRFSQSSHLYKHSKNTCFR